MTGDYNIPKEWWGIEGSIRDLIIKTHIELSEYMERYYGNMNEDKPNRWDVYHMAKCWRELDDFLSNFKEGDRLLHFRSPQDAWDKLCGSEGYIIVSKDNTVIDYYITFMN